MVGGHHNMRNCVKGSQPLGRLRTTALGEQKLLLTAEPCLQLPTPELIFNCLFVKSQRQTRQHFAPLSNTVASYQGLGNLQRIAYLAHEFRR